MSNENRKKDESAVGGIMLFAMLLAIAFIFMLGASEGSYSEKVSEQGLSQEEAYGNAKFSENYDGDSFSEWYNYVFNVSE